MSVDPSAQQTITIVKRLIPTLNEDEDNDVSSILEEVDEDLYDMFRMTTDGTFSSASFGSEEGRRLSLSLSGPPSTRRTSKMLIRSRRSRVSSSEPVQDKEGRARKLSGKEKTFRLPVEETTQQRVRKRDRIKAVLQRRGRSVTDE